MSRNKVSGGVRGRQKGTGLKPFDTNRVATLSQPRLQLKRINFDTQSIHSVDSVDDFDVLSRSPTPTTSGALVFEANRPNKLMQKSKKSTNGGDANQLLLSIKADTEATRSEIVASRRELKADINKLAQRSDAKFKAIDECLSATKNDIKILFNKVRAIETKPAQSAIDFELQKQIKLRNNISIVNVPILDRENLFDILVALLNRIDCNGLCADEVIEAKRIHNSKSNIIIVKLRDDWWEP